MDLNSFIGPAVAGTLAMVGSFVAVRVGVAEIKMWAKQHEKTDDERHQENQHRFRLIEEELRDTTRRDMREATGKMDAVSSMLVKRDQ